MFGKDYHVQLYSAPCHSSYSYLSAHRQFESVFPKLSVISSRDQTPEGHKGQALDSHLARSVPKRLVDSTSDDEPEFAASLSLNKSVVTVTKATRNSSEMSHHEGTLEGANKSGCFTV